MFVYMVKETILMQMCFPNTSVANQLLSLIHKFWTTQFKWIPPRLVKITKPYKKNYKRRVRFVFHISILQFDFFFLQKTHNLSYKKKKGKQFLPTFHVFSHFCGVIIVIFMVIMIRKRLGSNKRLKRTNQNENKSSKKHKS